MPTEGQTEIDWTKRSTPDGEAEIVRHYYAWSQQLAKIAIDRMPVQCDHDSLRSAAGLALLDAVRRYSPERGISFRTFATHRIRGAIIDAMRQDDHLSRTSRKFIKARIATEAKLLEQLGREPSIDEVRAELGWTKSQYWASLGSVVHSLEARLFHRGPNDSDATFNDLLASHPAHSLEAIDRQRDFEHTMRGFDFEAKVIIYLYYYRQATMKQIGTVLGIVESRVSQRHSAIIDQLKQLPERFTTT